MYDMTDTSNIIIVYEDHEVIRAETENMSIQQFQR
jgi:hypothetical protein